MQLDDFLFFQSIVEIGLEIITWHEDKGYKHFENITRQKSRKLGSSRKSEIKLPTVL